MAFDVNQYFQSQGRNIEQNEESIREAAEALLALPGRMSRNVSYEGWAQSALNALDDGDLERAHQWITGSLQPTRAGRVWSGYTSQREDIRDHLANAASNLANITDFSGNNPLTGQPFTEEEQQEFYNSEGYRDNLEEFNQYSALAEQYGMDPSAYTPVRQASGYVPYGEGSTGEGERNRITGRTGETLTYRQDSDGTYSVIGSSTGTAYRSGIADIAGVLAAQNELNTGSTPSISGIPGTPATAENLASYTAGTLPEQLSSLTSQLESSVSAAEAAALEADSSLEITSEMRAEWLAQAVDELSPYYSELIRTAEVDLGTSLTRLIEDVRAQESAYQRQYEQDLETQQANLQNRGMLYGSYRTEQESRLAEEANANLESLGRTLERGLSDTSLSAERYLGSENVTDLADTYGTTQNVGRVIAGTPTFESGDTSNVFRYSGDYTGALPQERMTEEAARSIELENAFRELNSSNYA